MAIRNPWDRIPKASVDFGQSIEVICQQYQDAYFEVQIFAVHEVARAERWRLSALCFPVLLFGIGLFVGAIIP